MQSEVFRFGNGVVDEWEGKVNAWPLDEGLIDYVEGQYGGESDSNPYYTANVIANKRLKVGSKTLDASNITKKVLRDLHEIGGVEANVATGYHAIEFLLWGQDLNGTGPGAGNRPWTDYSRTSCTHGNCDRRGQYLIAASELLVEDLAWIARQFAPAAAAEGPDQGSARCGNHRNLDRSWQPLVRGARRGAHEAWTDPPRPGGRARLLLGQHPQLALLRHRRHDQRVQRPVRAESTGGKSRDPRSPRWWATSRPISRRRWRRSSRPRWPRRGGSRNGPRRRSGTTR